MKNYFLAFFLFSSCFLVSENQYNLKSDPEIEKARTLLANLDREMGAFLRGKNHNLVLSEEYLKETGQWEEQVQMHNSFGKKMTEVQNQFLEFRKNLSEMVSLDLGDNAEASAHFSYSFHEITKWYVKFIEETLFPRDGRVNESF